MPTIRHIDIHISITIVIPTHSRTGIAGIITPQSTGNLCEYPIIVSIQLIRAVVFFIDIQVSIVIIIQKCALPEIPYARKAIRFVKIIPKEVLLLCRRNENVYISIIIVIPDTYVLTHLTCAPQPNGSGNIDESLSVIPE